jgi:hypothetical protein
MNTHLLLLLPLLLYSFFLKGYVSAPLNQRDRNAPHNLIGSGTLKTLRSSFLILSHDTVADQQHEYFLSYTKCIKTRK